MTETKRHPSACRPYPVGLITRAAACAPWLLAPALALATTVTNDLAVYLNFDNNLAAQAGTTHAGAVYTGGATNGPRYVVGRIGMAATFANTPVDNGQPTDWAVTLGKLDALYAGSFSVSLWERTSITGDGALVGNKDWSSGANVGWVISSLDVKNVNWNAVGGTRRDIDLNPPFSDGAWHLITVTFDRTANQVISYVDAVPVSTRDISPSGTASFGAGLNTLVGSSGSGADAATAEVDDLGIWTRVLTAAEIAEIYQKGQAGRGLAEEVTAPIGGLLGHWVFDSAHISGDAVANLTGGLPGRVSGAFSLATKPECLALDGGPSYVSLAEPMNTALMPATNLTAEAWVAIKSPTAWGGIVGCIQDNGSFERGWLLGYLNSNFSFGVSSDGTLTYMPAASSFEVNRWYHVAGSYDGATMRLYVNGQLAASSTAEKGGIMYAPAPYVIAAYKDDNEFYGLDGYLREVSVYAQTLTADEILAHYNAQKDQFPAVVTPPVATNLVLALGPYVRFTGEDTAAVCYETATPQPSIVEFGESAALGTRVADATPKTNHVVALTGLKPKTKYAFVVRQPWETNEISTGLLEFETDYNFTVPPLPEATPYTDTTATAFYEAAARAVVTNTGIRKGYALDYGCGDGQFALALARCSELNVVGITPDAQAADRARRTLQAAGLYGPRVTILQAPLDRLPHTKYAFNLVVSSDALGGKTLPGTSAELFRVLRPSGGVALLGLPPGVRGKLPNWAELDQWVRTGLPTNAMIVPDDDRAIRVAAGGVPGGGEWTHPYGDPGATACSHDERVRASGMRIQWFGEPGPRGFTDRGNRPPQPLTANGLYYVQGNNRVFAQDAYNGRILWELEVPNLRRLNIPRDAGAMCADQDSLYLPLAGRCLRLDGYTGQLRQAYPLPAATNSDWGYIACVSNRVYGSSVKKSSFYTVFDQNPVDWYDSATALTEIAKICSDDLFCLALDGTPLWTYRNGVIINSTIAIGGGRIYFVDSRNPALASQPNGRISSFGLWSENHLVALDAATGSVLWDAPLSLPSSPYPVVLFLSYADEKLILNDSTSRFNLYCYAAADGSKLLWFKSFAWLRGDHGHHMYHPVIAGNKVILEPNIYDLNTGALLKTGLRDRGGCNTMSAAAYTAHYCESYSSASVFFWDLENNQTQNRRVAGMRASCWMSVISGGGMVLMPAVSAGCVCGFPLQTSMGFSAP